MQHSLAMLKGLADSENPKSFANRLRDKRFRYFEYLVALLPLPVSVLDVGGTNVFWENRGWAGRTDIEIVTVNLVAEPQRHPNIRPLAGDATHLSQFADHSFDIVFSNSVIEHLFHLEAQRRMASEIRRVGKTFYVQTPNFWFPIEPHFHVPGWQWMPVDLRISLIRRWACGWRGPCPDPTKARKLVEEIRLLCLSELKALFPGANFVAERFCGLVKSWIALGGFDKGDPHLKL